MTAISQGTIVGIVAIAILLTFCVGLAWLGRSK